MTRPDCPAPRQLEPEEIVLDDSSTRQSGSEYLL